MSATTAPLDLESVCLAAKTSRFEASLASDGTTTEATSMTTTILISILSSLLSLMIVVGNGLIIVSVVIVKKLRQPANYLIVSLALSDFLVGLIVLPLTIVYDIEQGWVLGPMMCDVHVSFDVICCTASIMNLCMISIDRYFVITKPMTYPKRRNGKLMALLIATAWLMSCLIIIPALFGFTENVKDGPGWLRLPYNAVVDEGGRLVGTNEFQARIWNGSHNASAAIDNNSTTFWDPGEILNKPDIWHFTLDLREIYKLTKVRFQNAGDNVHDVLQYNIQGYVCKEEVEAMFKKVIHVKEGTDELQVEIISGIPQARYIRVNINETVGDNQPNIREFTIYGEKIEGKTCLISQEVWFTIYSTVGAFYIPLAVMLYMYQKIYAEALKFKLNPSQRRESWTVAQNWKRPSRQPLASDSSCMSCQTTTTNNRTNSIGDCKNTQINTNCDVTSDSDDHLCCNNHGITILVSDVDEEDQDKDTASYDDETVFSDSECFVCGCNDNSSQSAINTETHCCNEVHSLSSENSENKDLNGNCQNLETNSSQSSPACKPKKISFSDPLLPPNCTIRCHERKPISILRARADQIVTNNLTNKSMNAPSLPSNGIINKRTKPNCTNVCDKQLLNNICNGSLLQVAPDVFHERFESDNVLLPWNKESPCLKLVKQTEGKIESYNKSGNRSSRIISHFAICCAKSFHCESPSSQSSMFSSRSSNPTSPSRRRSSIKRLSFSPANKKKSKFYNGSLETDSSVIDQIKRRVSMAISRDRKRNVKAARTLGVVVGAFTFCWLPFFIVTFLRPIVCENPESQDCIPVWLVRLVLWLGYLNSALNPFIYVGFSPDLRETFRFLLSFKCTNVDRRLAQAELRQAICREKRASVGSLTRCAPAESIL